ncbi:MAG: hypothetical protein GY805_03110, partial [Chloroflexi bacterium]|nr:hypothetical protein [Chloroflexota bacterium]
MLKRILMGIAALGVVALFFIGATAKRTTADSPFDTSPDSILKEPEDDTEYLGIPVTPMTREEIEQSAEEVFLQGNYTPLAVGDPLVAVSDEQAKSWEEVDWFEHFPEDMQDGLLALEQNSTSPSLPPPLNRSVQAIAPGRTGEKEFALFGGDGGVHRLIRDKDNGWTSEPFGLPISFISRLGHLPDGGLYAADYWNFYTLYPGDSSWQLVYNPEETGGGAVYDVAIVGDADDYTLYLATLKGVWAGKPDTNDWRLVSPPDAMAWSAVAVNNDAVYFGGERVADQPSPQSSNNEEPEEPETVGVVWKLDINSNEWQMAAEWPELPIVRGMIYDPEMGVIAQGQGGVRFEQLGWQAAPGDEGFREIYASLVDEQGVWVGGVGKDGLQLFSRDGKWHTYPLDGISINATVSSLQRVENLMLAGTSDGLVVLELDDSDSLVSRQYLPPPDKASMRVLYKPPTPYYTGHDWGQLYNWKWCEVKAGVPVEIK